MAKFLPLGAFSMEGLDTRAPLEDGITEAAPLIFFELGTASINRN